MEPKKLVFANPWLWLALGLSLVGIGAVIAYKEPDAATGAIFATLGLLCVAIGAAIRLGSEVPSYTARKAHAALMALLTVFLVGWAALFTWTLAAAFLEIDPFDAMAFSADPPFLPHVGPRAIGDPPPLRPGIAIILWLLIVPMCGVAAFQSQKLTEWNRPTETAVLTMFAFVAVLGAGFAMPTSATTLKFFFAILALFTGSMAAFAASSVSARKLVLSCFVLLHFGAIINATMAVPPAPWIFNQTWTRLSRPYLEFMYLNNAYHFYSPDPGPSSYVLFCLNYDTGKKAIGTDDPELSAVWTKLPKVDANGNHEYRVALEYQRCLALTENILPSEVTPSLIEEGPDGMIRAADFYAGRLVNSPSKDGERLSQPIVGLKPPKLVLKAPFHPSLTTDRQYIKPDFSSRKMLGSLIRRAARTPHPENPTWKIHSVRVYRVVHHPVPPHLLIPGTVQPDDPTFYHPVYLGLHDANGTLIDPNEPLLYWIIPAVRKDRNDPSSPILNYAFRHASDPRWVYYPDEKQWTTPRKPEDATP